MLINLGVTARVEFRHGKLFLFAFDQIADEAIFWVSKNMIGNCVCRVGWQLLSTNTGCAVASITHPHLKKISHQVIIATKLKLANRLQSLPTLSL